MATVISDLQIGSSGLTVQPSTGTQGAGKRLSIAAPASGGTAEIEVLPFSDVSQSGMNSQIILYGKTGTDYERFAISEINHETRIDLTANNNGTIRNVIFIMGGYETYQSTGKARTGQNALILVADASVRLQGSTFTVASSGSEAGGTFGSERTTVYDFGNTGTSRLIVGTRQSSPNTGLFDEASVEYMRSNVSKWRAGLNASSGGADSFEWYSGGARMALTTDGKLGIGVAPSYMLHVQKSVSSDAIAKLYNSASDGYGFGRRGLLLIEFVRENWKWFCERRKP